MISLLDQLTKANATANMRKCSHCREYKPHDQFSIKDKKRGWLDTRCKSCKCALAKTYRIKEKDHEESSE